MFTRIALFLGTNIAIIALISIILSFFNIHHYLTPYGINYESLLIFAALFGFSGSMISLFISKWMAKRAYSIHIIGDKPQGDEVWLQQTVHKLASRSGIGKPEVGIYQSPEPNAFATGPNRNNALVAVSTGILQLMNKDELEGVLGHEVSHIANGDMITMSLLQGVINTFVIFFARIAAFFVTQFLRGNDEEGSEAGDTGMGGIVYYLVAFLFEIVFGILASVIVMWFSRFREFRADKGSAALLGKQKMILALERLQQATQMPEDKRAPAMDTMKISSRHKFLSLFSSHPPIEARINQLKRPS